MTAASAVLALSVFSADFETADAQSAADQVIEEGKKHLGTPYRYGGTSPSGFDCSGYLVYIFDRAIDQSLPRTAAAQASAGDSVSKSNLQPGDLVFFNTSGRGVSHSGLYIGGGDMIHSASSRGISIVSINDPHYWGSRYVGAQRVITEQEEVASETSPPSLDPGYYHDVRESHFAFEEIRNLGQADIINGYPDGTYKPTRHINRGQAAALVARSFDLDTSGNPGYDDVGSNHHQAEAVAAVEAAGFFDSIVDNNEFKPSQAITRGEIAAVFFDAFELDGMQGGSAFDDIDESHEYFNQIMAFAGTGISTGNDGNYQPERETNRAHFAVFLDRAMEINN